MTPKELLDDFVRRQRGNTYHSFLSAFVLPGMIGIVATWSAEGIGKVVGDFDAGKAVLPTLFAHASRLLLPAIFFVYLLYMWFHFTRIFVYVAEGTGGRLLSYLLAVTVLVSLASMLALPNLWAYVLSVCLILVGIKSLHVRLSLPKLEPLATPTEALAQEHGEQLSSDHPIRKESASWACAATGYGITLLVLARGVTLLETPTDQQGLDNLLMVVFALISIINFTKYSGREVQLRKEMIDFAERHPEYLQ